MNEVQSQEADAPIDSAAVERQQALRKEYLIDVRRAAFILQVGAILWPLAVVYDYIQSVHVGEGRLSTLVLLRFGGEACLLVALYRLKRSPPPTERQFDRINFAVMLVVSTTLAMMCVATSGFTSIYVAGNLLTASGVIFVPMPFRRALVRVVLTLLPHPVIMTVGTYLYPSLRAQLEDPRVVAIAVQHFFMAVVLATGLAGFSNAFYHVRNELYESRSIGRYRLRRMLGRGGSSEIWAAYHNGLKRDVALKILEPKSDLDPSATRRFEREVRMTASLTHPNTVRVFDFGTTEDGLLFYAMEILEGENLSRFVKKRGALPPGRAVHLARQAASALAEAHSRGIVHRDVKPENLFVTRVGMERDFVKVLDFGIAILDEGSSESPIVTEVAGTITTISPEVIRGGAAVPASDVYGMGVVLYFMLTGSYPFDARAGRDGLVAHLETPPTPPSVRLGERLPSDLEGLVLACLAKEPHQRPRDGQGLAEALERIAERTPWNPRLDVPRADSTLELRRPPTRPGRAGSERKTQKPMGRP